MVPDRGRLANSELQILAGSAPVAWGDVPAVRMHVDHSRFSDAGTVVSTGTAWTLGIEPTTTARTTVTDGLGGISTFGFDEALDTATGLRIAHAGLAEARAFGRLGARTAGIGRNIADRGIGAATLRRAQWCDALEVDTGLSHGTWPLLGQAKAATALGVDAADAGHG